MCLPHPVRTPRCRTRLQPPIPIRPGQRPGGVEPDRLTQVCPAVRPRLRGRVPRIARCAGRLRRPRSESAWSRPMGPWSPSMSCANSPNCCRIPEPILLPEGIRVHSASKRWPARMATNPAGPTLRYRETFHEEPAFPRDSSKRRCKPAERPFGPQDQLALMRGGSIPVTASPLSPTSQASPPGATAW